MINVVFEGSTGSGKTTAIKAIKKKYEKRTKYYKSKVNRWKNYIKKQNFSIYIYDSQCYNEFIISIFYTSFFMKFYIGAKKIHIIINL